MRAASVHGSPSFPIGGKPTQIPLAPVEEDVVLVSEYYATARVSNRLLPLATWKPTVNSTSKDYASWVPIGAIAFTAKRPRVKPTQTSERDANPPSSAVNKPKEILPTHDSVPFLGGHPAGDGGSIS